MSSSTLNSFLSSIDKIDKSSFKDDGEKNEALLAAYALVSRLESPWEVIARTVLIQPALNASLKIAIDLGLFKKWQDLGGGPKSSEELAELTGCELSLLDRMLRHLAANNILSETSPRVFTQLDFSTALTEPAFREGLNYLYDATLPSYMHLPGYLAKNGYTTPLDPKDGVFQHALSFKGGLFDYYATHPREGETFNVAMGSVMANQASWLDLYPHDSLVTPAAGERALTDEDVILVDVGGNVGYDIERFRSAHPSKASNLVLQDTPEVIAKKTCSEPIRAMAHDFFEPQPVKGARAYFLHAILHDWPDDYAQRILTHIKDAMTPGWSKLLIYEYVIPEGGAHPQATGYDLTMMVLLASLERTESGWRKLLESAGLKIEKIYSSKLTRQSIIEAVVA